MYDVDQKIRSEQFRFAAEALRTQKLKTYVPAFVQEAQVGRVGGAGVGGGIGEGAPAGWGC